MDPCARMSYTYFDIFFICSVDVMVCSSIHAPAHARTHTCNVHTHTCTSIYTQTHMRLHTHTHMYIQGLITWNAPVCWLDPRLNVIIRLLVFLYIKLLADPFFSLFKFKYYIYLTMICVLLLFSNSYSCILFVLWYW